MLKDIASAFLVLIFVLCIVSVAWYLLWTFVIAKNPLVRDFFDMDRIEDDQDSAEKKKNR